MASKALFNLIIQVIYFCRKNNYRHTINITSASSTVKENCKEEDSQVGTLWNSETKQKFLGGKTSTFYIVYTSFRYATYT